MNVLRFIAKHDMLLKSHNVISDLIKQYPNLLDEQVMSKQGNQHKQSYDIAEIHCCVEELIATHFQLNIPLQAIMDLTVDMCRSQKLNEQAFDEIYQSIVGNKGFIQRIFGNLIFKQHIEKEIVEFLDEYQEFIKVNCEGIKVFLLNDEQRQIWLEECKPVVKFIVEPLLREYTKKLRQNNPSTRNRPFKEPSNMLKK